MSTDATPSWSGYIFQGEVALCKAVEKINELDDIQLHHCLRLEEDEDFSIQADTKDIFQVKAFTVHNYTKYKKAWNDMMGRFDEDPGNNYLYIQKDGFENEKFRGVDNENFVDTNVISGEYSLENINQKLLDAFRTYMDNDNLIEDDIDLKVKFSCQLICDLIKERHRTKLAQAISFNEIIDWIDNKAPLSFNEDVFWFTIEKLFFQALREMLADYEPVEEDCVDDYNELQSSIGSLELLKSKEIKKMFLENIGTHKIISNRNLRGSLADYISKNGVQNIIGKALSIIKVKPDFKKLLYQITVNERIIRLQLTTNNDSFDIANSGDLNRLQKQCEIINQSIISNEIDYFITEHITVSKAEMGGKLLNITNVESPVEINVTNSFENGVFGLKKIIDAINEINE